MATAGTAYASEDETVALGRRLLTENDRNGACHQKRSPSGDAIGLYIRPDAKVMHLCVSNLNTPVTAREIRAQ
ncbi:hypothetical protein [Bradyrhizobium sp.]|uniref:hypothetical protein n=1 Tax=Bradyrhizobium sp. TaxID=376 RepID=UPI003C709F17